VLVAEDDGELRRLIRLHLMRDGHEVIEAVDGRKTLDALADLACRGDRLRAILMDVRMPGLGGLTILQALTASGSAVPVVLMTAFGTEELRRDAVRSGAHAVLDKPFAMERLRETLGGAIAASDEHPRRSSWSNDSLLVDRYLDVVNRGLLLRAQLRLAAPGGIRGTVAFSVVEPGPGGVNTFHLQWRGWGFVRATRPLENTTASRCATRQYLERVILEPWHWLAHPEQLVLWR
jgi:CheY-like chemotaxis protein